MGCTLEAMSDSACGVCCARCVLRCMVVLCASKLCLVLPQTFVLDVTLSAADLLQGAIEVCCVHSGVWDNCVCSALYRVSVVYAVC